MPIAGFYCVKCRMNVPLDHYESCDSVHPDYAAAVIADGVKHRAAGVHVTAALSCPRRTAIETSVNVFIEPSGLNAPLGGTAWHKLMETASDHPELCEVEVAGVIGGIAVVGTVDRLHPPTAISDWKTTSEWAEKYLMKPKAEGGGMKPDHLAQLSLYAELVEQSLGWRPKQATVWYRTHKTMLKFTELVMPLDEVLKYHPVGGDYSVGELLHQLATHQKWQAGEGGAQPMEWKNLPLVGETMKYGNKTLCDYCGVREVCWTQARGAPF